MHNLQSEERPLEEVVQFRYLDREGDLSELGARDVADVLEGLVELNGEFGRAGMYGSAPAPEVRIRPLREGSFIIEAVLQWTQQNHEAIGAISEMGGTGALLVTGIRALTKSARAQPKDVEEFGDGQVKVTWQDDTVSTIPVKAWDKLQSSRKKTKKALSKIMAPLGDEADELQVRSGSTDETTQEIEQSPVDLELRRDDYRVAIHEEDDTQEDTREFSTEGVLTTIDFSPDGKWRIATTEGTRQAAIEDESFLRRIDQGLALHKTDIFTFKIREDVTVKNGRTSTAWTIVEVQGHRRGVHDDDPQPSHNDPK